MAHATETTCSHVNDEGDGQAEKDDDDQNNNKGNTKATTKKTTSTSTTSTTTTTTQRPIPPNTLVCTYGPAITASSPFPKDGVCDYTILEQMPASRAEDFGEPYPPEVKHFIDTAARHTKTEFGVAFDYE
ncbi:uncharacterized protein LOC125941088 [Dermacentor silvarum]|uniref:uncharacterized protein LOC125941088 n=1 Tax=Dermacentor silvarum TaxID=543639 RepID=UPI00210100B6|nr:uncharacterized protein LOC125941088 [Dermacentor silvarum]